MAQIIRFVNKQDKQEMRQFSDMSKRGEVKLAYRRPGFVQVMTPRKMPVAPVFDPPEAA